MLGLGVFDYLKSQREQDKAYIVELENSVKKLQANNKRLRKYTQHKGDCLLLNWEVDNELPCDECDSADDDCEMNCDDISYYTKCKNEGMVCTCELDDLLKE